MPNYSRFGEFNEKRESWENYVDRLDEFFVANEITDAARKRAILNSVVGPETYKLISSLLSPTKPKDSTYEAIVEKLKKHFTPIKSSIMARHLFDNRLRRQGESVTDYLACLRTIAKDCKFGDGLDEKLRDRFVTGINDPRMTKNLMTVAEDKLDLKKAVEVAQALELANEHSKTLQKENPSPASASVDVLHPPASRYHNSKPQGARPRTYKTGTGTPTPHSNPTGNRSQQACGNCGKKHPQSRCPAQGKQCHSCGKMNHLSRYCRSKRYRKFGPQRNVHDVELNVDPPTEQMEEFHIESLRSPMNLQDEIYTTVDVGGSKLTVKLDTGAKCNVLPLHIVNTLQRQCTINTRKRANLIAFGGTTISTVGVVTLPVNRQDIEFYVVDLPGVKALLGLKDCLRLNLIALSAEVFEVRNAASEVDAFTEFPTLFDSDVGKLPVTYHMTLDSSVTPVVRPARRVPAAMQDKVQQELNRMVQIGVITPCTEPTDWVSAMVAQHKKGTDEIRVCIDPRDLNKALKRPHHPTKTVEEVAAKMDGATIFSVLDAKSSFWQVPLDHQSSMLTCFSTPYGRFRFLRMPYGLCASSDVFQHAMETLFEGLPCSIIVDDILVGGKDQQEHDKNLRQVLNRAKEVNLKLNPSKCKFGVSNVGYVGHLFTSDGLKPDPDKVTAIRDMPKPDSVLSLQRFLGMVNYLAKFIPDLSEIAAPLRELTHKTVAWCWYDKHQQAYDQIQKLVINTPLLKYYDVTKPVTLTCDASKFGLGAACLQDGEPIAYASRTMKSNELNYAQIEKELLAVVFACHKFYDYIYGKQIVVETDHKPLVTIIKKPMHAIPARLQHMMLQLQKFDITLVYKKGAELYVADTLSRAPLPERVDDIVDTERFEVMTVLPISTSRMSELQRATAEDPVLQTVGKYIQQGWPERATSVPQLARKFYTFRDELTIQDDIVMKGLKPVIPQSLQATYVKLLHEGHIGAESTKRRGRDIVFWLSMSHDIDNHVSSCSVCNSTKPHQPKEPMKSHPLPTLPWQTVGVDLFEWNGLHYMAIGDLYSGWFDMASLNDQSAQTVIQKLKRQFCTHGTPATVITDNARQFDCQAFSDFAKCWDFKHITSSPYYPQSNGLAESAVKRAKQLLEKTKRDNSDLYQNLLNVRNVPTDSQLGSPAQRLMSRRLRTAIPTSASLLKPSVNTQVTPQLEKRRKQQQTSYDKSATPLPPLKPGQVIRLQTPKGHDKLGVVVSSSGDPRSYIVNVNGTEYRRNRRHILPVNEPAPRHQQTADDDILVHPATQPQQANQPSEQPAPVVQQPHVQPAMPQPVVTRSGRLSKPNPKYFDYAQ